MPKRTITNDEIALIKAMLVRKMKNKDIQFFFNRPDRPVNSGRITGIANGTYGTSMNIAAKSEAELDAFMAAVPCGGTGPSTIVVDGPDVPGADPLAESIIISFFEQSADGLWRLTLGETDTHECKASFRIKYPSAWLRAIAALANNAGGYIFFGVGDKGATDAAGADLSHVAIGLKTEEFAATDPAAITMEVKSVFDPTPRVRIRSITVGGKSVGVIHVERHGSRPVIATKTRGDDVREGDIYFRYPGQSSRIKYSDLRTLLDERDRDARTQIMPMVERLLQLGPQRSMIADLTEGTLGDSRNRIQIDGKLIEKLTFIKEGEFSEVEGAPTLRLIGNVEQTTGGHSAETKMGLLTRDAVIDAFLDQAKPDDPERYIRFAVEVSQGEWLPLHYFASLSGKTRIQLIDFIVASKATTKRKATYVKRVQLDAAYSVPIGTPKAFLDKLLAGNSLAVVDAKEAGVIAQAIEGLPADFQIDRSTMLCLLKQCHQSLQGKPGQSYARRAICRVDEILFGKAP